MLLISLIKFISSAILLSVSAVFIVRSLIKIARYFRLSDFTASFIVIASATSLPELSVAITAAIANSPEITVGAVIGSNIANLTIVTGLTALVARQINVVGIIKKRDASYMTYINIIMLLLIADRSLSRPDGAILLLIYIYYIWRLFQQQKYFEQKPRRIKKNHIFQSLAIFGASIAVLLVSADLAVKSAQEIGLALSLPVIFIGMIVVALGTSLPELVFGLGAIKEGKRDLAMGDLIGSVVTNSTLILGLTAFITPISFSSFGAYDTGIVYFIITLLLFNIFMWSKKELSWREGISLIFVYILFLGTQFFVGVSL